MNTMTEFRSQESDGGGRRSEGRTYGNGQALKRDARWPVGATHQMELAPRPENAVPFGGDDRLEREAQEWMHTKHGREIMRIVYAEVAIVLREAEPGQRISMDYIIHRLRFRLRKIRCRMLRFKGIPFSKSGGYALNDHHTAYISRHVTGHRPEWSGHIEQRRVGKMKPRIKKTVTVVTEVSA